jgi:hypothetical protein
MVTIPQGCWLAKGSLACACNSAESLVCPHLRTLWRKVLFDTKARTCVKWRDCLQENGLVFYCAVSTVQYYSRLPSPGSAIIFFRCVNEKAGASLVPGSIPGPPKSFLHLCFCWKNPGGSWSNHLQRLKMPELTAEKGQGSSTGSVQHTSETPAKYRCTNGKDTK